MNEFTVKRKVLGLLVAGQYEFYVLDWKKLTDNDGKDLNGIGWLATSTTPLNEEMLIDKEVMPIYNPPTLVIGGSCIFSAPIPQEIEVFNVEYDDEMEELSEEDLKKMPEKMDEEDWNVLLSKLENMKIKGD